MRLGSYLYQCWNCWSGAAESVVWQGCTAAASNLQTLCELAGYVAVVLTFGSTGLFEVPPDTQNKERCYFGSNRVDNTLSI